MTLEIVCWYAALAVAAGLPLVLTEGEEGEMLERLAKEGCEGRA